MALYIGLMSGTSMDGIDAALVDVASNTLLAGITLPYSTQAQQALRDLSMHEKIAPGYLSQINMLLGKEFAEAAQRLIASANVNADRIIAIGSHGQTICHDATAEIPYTLQLGCPHTIAELTGKTVVADFRTRDMVIGGKGAPFAPIYHQALFGSLDEDIAVINIGGIANITHLIKGRVSGYDVGPGNCLLDAWTQKHKGEPYDKNGEWSLSGQIIEPLLQQLLEDPYFHLSIPKSVGKEYFSLAWLFAHLQENYRSVDIQATLLALTVKTISQAIQRCDPPPKRVAICGGGARNLALLNMLTVQLSNTLVQTTQAMSIDPDFLEAMMFAWLAEKTLNHVPLDMRQITGAQYPAILGVIYPRGLTK
jgi:anhydro-N-acetylmuramic acid kinase